MKDINNEIEIVRPEEIQEQIEKMDKESYSGILKRINSQLESARENGSRSKVLACVDVNILEVDTSIVKAIVTNLREVGWKVGTKVVPFTHSGALRVPDMEMLHKSYELGRGLTGLRITVYHPSVSDELISNTNDYKNSKE